MRSSKARGWTPEVVKRCVFCDQTRVSAVINSLSYSMQNLSSRGERVKLLRKYLRKHGVPEEYIFEEEDLTEFKNIPKVTRCFAMLAKMVS